MKRLLFAAGRSGTWLGLTRLGFRRPLMVAGAVALLLALSACSSVPTSSDATIGEGGVTAKGGTIACASGLHATLTDGEITSLDCATQGAWTDPPTEAEVSAAAAIGTKLVEVLAMPLTALAALGRMFAGVATP